jgi:3-deoxy-D-manno-octulosonic acid kinase
LADRIGEVPEGYVVHRVADTYLVLDRAHAAELVPLRLADPEVRQRLFARAPVRGRGAAPSLAVTPALDMVLRRYRHGGLLGAATGSLYLGPGRALAELRVAARAEASGAPVPHVLCLVLWPVLGPFWSAMIGTREERGARHLLELAQQLEPAPARAALAREVGQAVRRLHDAGVEHRDLQLRNVLAVDRGAGARRIVVIDLDRAVYHPGAGVPVHLRAANLGRLTRSVIKNGLWDRRVGDGEASAFLEGYTGEDRALRSELRGWVARERFKIRLHRLGYRWRRPVHSA